MAMSDLGPAFAQIICQNAQWVVNWAKQLWIAQWASAASMARNEKEQAELSKIAEGGGNYVLSAEGSSISFHGDDSKISPFQDVIENGSNPVLGGDGGTAHNPDGSTYQSRVPPQLYGTIAPWLSHDADPVEEGIQTMLGDLVPRHLQDAASQSKDALAPLVKDEIAAEIRQYV